MLQKFAASSSLDVKYSAIQALIQNKQALDPLAVEKLATDHYYRVSLYSSLKEDGRLNLFPARFHNQKSIAESELFSIAADDGEPSKMEAIGERVLPYRGKRMKFYLFKVTYDYEGGSKETYLGVAGPFDISSKEIKTETEATGLVSELYNAKKTDQQLKDYLAEMEEYEAE